MGDGIAAAISAIADTSKLAISLYVCQAARQNGRSSCPTKSVPARMIEDSVLDQLRTALCTDATRKQLNVSEADWQAFEEGHFELVRSRPACSASVRPRNGFVRPLCSCFSVYPANA
jgi:hypothetical protein